MAKIDEEKLTMINNNDQSPQFRVLSEDQCRGIIEATFECLEKVGIMIQHEEARDMLTAAGAAQQNEIVYIPRNIVKSALNAVPSEFSVCQRDDRGEIKIAINNVLFGPGPTCTYFIDPQSGARRKARRGDAALTAKVCDALPNIDFIMGLSLFDDVTPILSPVYEFAESIANTTKPVIAWANTLDTLQDIYAIAEAVAGGRNAFISQPNFLFFTTYESPLKLAHDPIANMLWAARQGIPIICLGGPTVGVESPFTGASALVIHLASALAALTLVQSANSGAPMVIGGVPSMVDLRSGRPAYGSPEMSLHSAAAVDVARYLRIPFMGTAGASESKLINAQAGIEAAIQVLLSLLSGAALVHDVGFLDCADIGSLPYLILVDEIIGMTKRIMRGIPVNTESIMFDLIQKVGPGGVFLNQPRSASIYRREVWIPTVLERAAYNLWEKGGYRTCDELVLEKLDRILKTHQPVPLSKHTMEVIEKVIEKAKARENQL
ncbi:MAG: trimethylamine methyltransferase family protein [Anaerolineales bacterium]|nr:trimethylamine methyltransferase family protein [Anaerolineales bacterium]